MKEQDFVMEYLLKQEKKTGIYCRSDYLFGLKIWNLAIKHAAVDAARPSEKQRILAMKLEEVEE
jgi:hypothetical protein